MKETIHTNAVPEFHPQILRTYIIVIYAFAVYQYLYIVRTMPGYEQWVRNYEHKMHTYHVIHPVARCLSRKEPHLMSLHSFSSDGCFFIALMNKKQKEGKLSRNRKGRAQ